jgi:hypothetical protein
MTQINITYKEVTTEKTATNGIKIIFTEKTVKKKI